MKEEIGKGRRNEKKESEKKKRRRNWKRISTLLIGYVTFDKIL